MPVVNCSLNNVMYDCSEFVCVYKSECNKECNINCEKFDTCKFCNFNEYEEK